MASTRIGALVYNIEARTEKFSRDLDKANKGIRQIERASLHSSVAINRLTSQFERFLVVIGGFFTAEAAIRFFEGLSSEIDALGKASEKLGILAKDLQVIQKAGEQFAGVATQQTTVALQRMVRRIAEAAQGTGEAIGAIEELGLDAAQLLAAGPRSAFGMIADAMQKVENQSDRVRLSMKLFDSEGVALVNVLTKGSAALAQMEARLRSMNALLEDEAGIDSVENMNDAWDNTQERFRGMGRQILTTISPALQQLANDVDKVTIAWTESWKAIGRFYDSFQFGGSLRQLRAEIARSAAQTERLGKAARAAMGVPGGTASLDRPTFPQGVGRQLLPEMLELNRAMESFVGPPRATEVDKLLMHYDQAVAAERENLEARQEFLQDWLNMERGELRRIERLRPPTFQSSGISGPTGTGTRGEYALIRQARQAELEANERRQFHMENKQQRAQIIAGINSLTEELAQTEKQLEGI